MKRAKRNLVLAACLIVVGGAAAETRWGPWQPFAPNQQQAHRQLRPGTRRIGNRMVDIVPVLATSSRTC